MISTFFSIFAGEIRLLNPLDRGRSREVEVRTRFTHPLTKINFAQQKHLPSDAWQEGANDQRSTSMTHKR